MIADIPQMTGLPCDKEPIHVPGAVQDFAMLMALDPAGRIAQVSDNVAAFLGLTPAQVRRRRFVDLFRCASDGVSVGLSPSLADEIAAAPGRGTVGRWLQLQACTGHHSADADAVWDAHIHAQAGITIVELELDDGDAAAVALPGGRGTVAGAALVALRSALAGLLGASGSADLFVAMAREVREITGFDRALVYRFDPQWHGEVVAQAGGEGRPSFLGHHFPASDIPPQARAVFRQNGLRIIPDVARPASRLVPQLNPDSGQPLDLGHATWRSPADVHLTYLRNMDACASLTLSIICEGRLWGLVACHHFSPRFLSAPWRLAAELVGRQSSALLSHALVKDQAGLKRALGDAHTCLAAQMRADGGLVAGLTQGPVTLQAFAAEAAADSGAGGAALLYEGRWHVLGQVPPADFRDALVAWLGAEHAQSEVWHCDNLGQHFAPAAAHADCASGLMALVVDTPLPTAVLWFRPEVVREIAWAGAPMKVASPQPDGPAASGTIDPRRSFEAWRQVVRGTSRPFCALQRAAAAQLRHSITEFDLIRQVQVAVEAARAREFFVGMVSHDLRNPLSVIGLVCDRELRRVARESHASPKWQAALKTLVRAKNTMLTLVEDVLDVSKIEGGGISVEPTPMSCAELLAEAQASLLPLAQAKQVDLQVAYGAAADAAPVVCDRQRILQVIGNLVANALKFTPAHGQVVLRARLDRRAWSFVVQDSGGGIAAEHLPHIFESFWQGGSRRHGGAGLGLAISRGIVEAHGGKIWAESPAGGGAGMHFTLPLV